MEVMPYCVLFSSDVVKKDIPKLPKSEKEKIRKAIDAKLKANPIHFGKSLRYSLSGHRRLRIGDYRVIYRIDHDTKEVFISAIKHRKEVYE